MSEPSSLFVKIKMSRRACNKWLESPVRHVSDYTDWHEMNPYAAANLDDLRDTRTKLDYMSVGEFLDSLADYSRYFCCEYDDDERAFFIADVHNKASATEIAICLAALRGAESFKDDDEPSFIYIFPALSGGDPDAILRIRRGGSDFLPPNDASGDLLYFVNEAEEFIEALVEDDEG
jgi:hypothetical protein